MDNNEQSILSVENLRTWFLTESGLAKAVDGVSFEVRPGKILAIIGESGCGKSVTAYSILRLLPMPPGYIVEGRVLMGGRDLLDLDENAMRHVRGKDISMIFQEPMTSLNPVLSVGYQLREAIMMHQEVNKDRADQIALEMLKLVRVSDPEQRLSQYPYEFSGGMRQRIMIAMALVCRPKLLIADEPTTALDVTIQAQILNLIVRLKEEIGTAVMLITHDLGVVAETADDVMVMYAGRVVERASVNQLFAHPSHPYTQGLLTSIPKVEIEVKDGDERQPLPEIPGLVPALTNLPPGCAFAPRCPKATARCELEAPFLRPTSREGHEVACWEAGECPHGKALAS